jgi:hypothetical protein
MQFAPLKGEKSRPRDLRKSMHQEDPIGRNSTPKGPFGCGSERYPLGLAKKTRGGIPKLS